VVSEHDTNLLAGHKMHAVRRLPGSGFDAIQSRKWAKALMLKKVILQAGKYISSHAGRGRKFGRN